MPGRTPRLYRVWAIASSTLCVALVGYIIASHVEESRSENLRTEALASERQALTEAAGPEATSPSDRPAAPPPATPSLPEGLRDLESEWISAADGPGNSGHAILIDLERRRELIVERCRHGGYFDEERQVPKPPDWRCETIVAGRVAGIEGSTFTVLGRHRGASRVSVARSGRGSSARLELTIDGDRISLAPGSKNDLLQRFERKPEIKVSKQRMFEYEAARSEEARRRAEERSE